MEERRRLTRFGWLSIATAIATIALKAAAYLLTGSVGLLSDALESGVNLVAAILALVALMVAAQPPDEEHAYGHTKAEYFSSGVEGVLILVAGLMIVAAAIERLIDPQELEQIGIGLGVSLIAGILNLTVALVLLRAGKRYESATLEANANHLLTDVWTSFGVLVGVGLVSVTGWLVLDPIIAIIVAMQILWTGFRLLRGSVLGLMDTALPAEESARVTEILESYRTSGVQYHALRTRRSGARRFVSVHVQVPGAWTVQRGHGLLEEIEASIRATLPRTTVFTHLEPIEDPASWEDISLDRREVLETPNE
jgi:cation diffusion facilitator family transporter